MSECLTLLEQKLLVDIRLINTALDFFFLFLFSLPLVIECHLLSVKTPLDKLKFIRRQMYISEIY